MARGVVEEFVMTQQQRGEVMRVSVEVDYLRGGRGNGRPKQVG